MSSLTLPHRPARRRIPGRKCATTRGPIAVMWALLWVEGSGRAAQLTHTAYLPLLSDATADHLHWAARAPVTLTPTPWTATGGCTCCGRPATRPGSSTTPS